MNEIIIREATIDDVGGIAYVHVKSWQESYKGIISDIFLENISYSKRLELRRSILASDAKDINLVAVDNETIIGFCDAGSIREDTDAKGEVYAIYLLDEYKGKGLGSKL